MLVLHNMVEGSLSLSTGTEVRCLVQSYFSYFELVLRTRYGTGSCPWPPQGWQREMRFKPIQKPLSAPCFCMASMVY